MEVGSAIGRKGLDVLQDCADQLGWAQPTTMVDPASQNKDSRKLIRAFNRVLRAMSAIDDWRFLRRQGEIELVAEYSTGLMQLTNSGTTATASADSDGNTGVFAQSMIGRALLISGHPVVYRIAAVPTTTTLTLDRAFIGTTSDGGTAVDDYPFRIAQDRYELPLDFDRPVDQEWSLAGATSQLTVRVREASEIRDRRIRRSPYSTNDPQIVTLWDIDDEGEHRIAIFDPYPSNLRLVRFDYQAVHPDILKDTQRILYELRQEELIIKGVEYLILSGPEDDQRAGFMLGQYLSQQMSSIAQTEIGQQRTVISADQSRAVQQRMRRNRRGYRIGWASLFDRSNYYDLPQ